MLKRWLLASKREICYIIYVEKLEVKDMNKLNLTAQDILDKEFNVDFKGYSASEVDSFLDTVLDDYQNYDENIEELQAKISELEAEIEALKRKNLDLESKQKVIDLANTTSYSSVDLLKRVARLEEEVYRK